MNVYLLAFVLGAAGLLVMAVAGLGQHGADAHGHDAQLGHGHHGHDVHGHAGHGHAGHGHAGHGHAAQHGHAHGDAHHAGHGHHAGAHDVRAALLALASPRVLFSVLLGVGAVGLLAGRLLDGPALAVAALAGGVLFERAVVATVWRFVERFGSRPARTLDTALFDEARAASGFDQNGEGLVALELDGQVVQLLGRLRAAERGLRVRAGDRLRVEDVDSARNRCTVSIASGGGA